jgi:hypothetical protein
MRDVGGLSPCNPIFLQTSGNQLFLNIRTFLSKDIASGFSTDFLLRLVVINDITYPSIIEAACFPKFHHYIDGTAETKLYILLIQISADS